VTTPAPPAGGLDNVLSHKYLGIPGWGWAVGAAGAGYIYLRRKSSTATSTSTGTTTQPYPTGFDYGPSYAAIQSEIQNLQQGQAQGSAGATGTATSTTTGTTSAATSTVPTMSGSGYWIPGSNVPVQTGSASYQWIPNASTVQSLESSGQQIYVQTAPGTFVPWGQASGAAGGTLAPGTPLFQQVQGSSS
jgi:hypothetical protein